MARARSWRKKLDSLPKQLVRNGRRLYGAVYTLYSGRRIYVAYRKHREIFRSGKQTITEAVQDGIAYWAIDDSTVCRLQREGVSHIGFLEHDTDDLWVTPIANFFDQTKFRILNYDDRGGALQRYLPLEHFERRVGAIKF